MSASLTPAEIKSEFSRLSKAAQLDLLFDLWNELGSDLDLKLSDAERKELDRRWERYEGDPGSAIPWEHAEKRLALTSR